MSSSARSSRSQRILGIDPGSRLAGYSCIEVSGPSIKILACDVFRLEKLAQPSASMADRLAHLHRGLSSVIKEYKPHALSIEKIFFAKNASSALSLGQARGVVLASAGMAGLEIHEYSATQIKKSITGHGRASKEQIQEMLHLLVGKRNYETWDASDAMAIAITHALMATSGNRLPSGRKKSQSLANAVNHRVP